MKIRHFTKKYQLNIIEIYYRKEEKKKLIRMPIINPNRRSLIKYDTTKPIFHNQIKQNIHPKLTLPKSNNIIKKRIGCKPIVNAYRAAISENQKQINILNMKKPQISNTTKLGKYISQTPQPINKLEEHKKLKRIGKKILTNAYKSTITTEQMQKQQPGHHTVTNKYQTSHSPEIKIRFINESIIDDKFQGKKEERKNQLVMGKIEENRDQAYDESLCENTVLQSKISEISEVEKNGQIHINCSSSVVSLTESMEELNSSKIKYFFLQTQIKQQKNQEIPKEQKKLTNKRNKSNFLSVPLKKNHSNNKSSQNKSDSVSINSFGLAADISSVAKISSQIEKTASQIDKSAQSFLSEEQKILQILNETPNKAKNSKISKLKPFQKQLHYSIKNNVSSSLDNKEGAVKNKRKKLDGCIEFGKYDCRLEEIEERREEDNRINKSNISTKEYLFVGLNKKSISKPSNIIIQLSVQEEDVRKSLKSSKQFENVNKLSKSTIIKGQKNFCLPNPTKLSSNGSYLHEGKTRNMFTSVSNLPNITRSSMHYQPSNNLKRQSIAIRFSHGKEKKWQNGGTKIRNSSKIQNKKYGVNKCVADARKVLNMNSSL